MTHTFKQLILGQAHRTPTVQTLSSLQEQYSERFRFGSFWAGIVVAALFFALFTFIGLPAIRQIGQTQMSGTTMQVDSPDLVDAVKIQADD